MTAPMFERITAIGSICAACNDAGRVTNRPSGRDGLSRLPISKHWVGAADGHNPFLAQICPVCDQFPSAPYITRRTRA